MDILIFYQGGFYINFTNKAKVERIEIQSFSNRQERYIYVFMTDCADIYFSSQKNEIE